MHPAPPKHGSLRLRLLQQVLKRAGNLLHLRRHLLLLLLLLGGRLSRRRRRCSVLGAVCHGADGSPPSNAHRMQPSGPEIAATAAAAAQRRQHAPPPWLLEHLGSFAFGSKCYRMGRTGPMLPRVVSPGRPSAACRAAAGGQVDRQPIICLLPLLPHQAVKQHLVRAGGAVRGGWCIDRQQEGRWQCVQAAQEQARHAPAHPSLPPTVEAQAAKRKVALNQRCRAS